MKTINRYLLLVLLPTIFYLAGAFYSVSFNIAHWAQHTRGLVALFSVMALPFAAAIIKALSEK